MSSLNILYWDSNFFKLKIGEIKDVENINNPELKDFDLLIYKNDDDFLKEINLFENTFEEVRVVFKKKIKYVKNEFIFLIEDTDDLNVKSEELYDLAFESGKYSRFKLDPNFTQKQFEDLYKQWVKNSLNKLFSDKIYISKYKNKIVGFVTIKKNNNMSATIGLISVHNDFRGKGLGGELLKKAEEYCFENKIVELRIPTQESNITACRFYTKNKYKIEEQLFIKHYWKKKS